jgi:flavin reductase (DIM6/NTAB) family NADH-FMN oxidoreductase RutF
MSKRSFPLGRVYGLLETGPVLLLTTQGERGPNVMAMSWHTMLEFEPPLVGCVVSNRDYSFAALVEHGECALNIPTVELAEQVVACGNHSGRDTDKFATLGLTAKAAKRVQAPLLVECYASLECRVVDRQLVDSYNFFVLEVVQAWVDTARQPARTLHHRGWGRFMVAGEEIELASKMP